MRIFCLSLHSGFAYHSTILITLSDILVKVIKNCDYLQANREDVLIRQGEKGYW